MSIEQQIEKDVITAMKARQELRVSTLRMVKTAFKNKQIEKRAEITDAEAQQILTTLIKQRRESVEMFTKGGREELAAKEREEIGIIEAYLPKESSADDIAAAVKSVIAEMTDANNGAKPSQKEMGSVMKAVQAKIAAGGARADGKQVSEMVKRELAD